MCNHLIFQFTDFHYVIRTFLNILLNYNSICLYKKVKSYFLACFFFGGGGIGGLMLKDCVCCVKHCFKLSKTALKFTGDMVLLTKIRRILRHGRSDVNTL